jgi:hypothetical protein
MNAQLNPYTILGGFENWINIGRYWSVHQGRRNWGGGQEGQLPPLPFTRRGKGGKGALSI